MEREKTVEILITQTHTRRMIYTSHQDLSQRETKLFYGGHRPRRKRESEGEGEGERERER